MNHNLQLKRSVLSCCIGLGIALSTAVPSITYAQSGPPSHAIEHLPDGRLKQSLSKLPPHIQEKVLQTLDDLDISVIDTLLLEADEAGELYYVEEGLTEYVEEVSGIDNSAVELPMVDVFKLHSNPGSPNKVFLDFDGGLISGRAWGGGASYESVPYDLDGNPSDFNGTERYRIHEIWSRVADDFSAFDIDVTTEAPSDFGSNTGWLLFTKDIDANGVAMPHQGAGGVAYVGVWGRSNYTYYQPALVYYNRLGNGAANYMAEAGSHELGHNLSLSHDGTSTEGYFRGLGSDSEPSSWAPIMGVGYYKNVTQWSKGEYPDANQTQDDIGIMLQKLGSSLDAAGSQAAPAQLVVDAAGQILTTNREDDPGNVVVDNKGTVQVDDSDWFQFIAGAGALDIRAVPAWDAFTRNSRRGANLDVGLRLYNSEGTLIASVSDLNETDATLQAQVSDGLYFLEVVGEAGPYASNYGSQGHYYLTGSIPIGQPDNTPPDPNPMSFSQQPDAISATEIIMQASIATDDQGGIVSYLFTCSGQSTACNDSDWQTDREYTASGLEPESEYCFTVMSRDLSGNTSTASANACATTPMTPPPPEPPLAPSELVVEDGQNGTAQLTWRDNASNETTFEIQREKQHRNGRWQSLQTFTGVIENTVSYVDDSGNGTFHYRVRAVNNVDSSVWTDWVEVTVTGAGGGGNDKPCRGKKCT